jgi:6-phosphofructokinase 1
LKTMVRALPHPPEPGQKRFRIAVLNAGAPAPGMNTAVRATVRLGLDQGHIMLAVSNGFEGFAEGDVREMEWTSVNGWASVGGSVLGTSRKIPKGRDMYAIARTIENHRIDALLVIGGWNAYESVYNMMNERANFPAFHIPIMCLPASISNNLPGSEFSIGADTALNNIVDAVDKIKQSAGATRRCFIVEVMGHWCGYLALMSALATGAERFYLPEEGWLFATKPRTRSIPQGSFARFSRRKARMYSTHALPSSVTCSRVATRLRSTASRRRDWRDCAWKN